MVRALRRAVVFDMSAGLMPAVSFSMQTLSAGDCAPALAWYTAPERNANVAKTSSHISSPEPERVAISWRTALPWCGMALGQTHGG